MAFNLRAGNSERHAQWLKHQWKFHGPCGLQNQSSEFRTTTATGVYVQKEESREGEPHVLHVNAVQISGWLLYCVCVGQTPAKNKRINWDSASQETSLQSKLTKLTTCLNTKESKTLNTWKMLKFSVALWSRVFGVFFLKTCKLPKYEIPVGVSCIVV